jgi:hypothetical protein
MGVGLVLMAHLIILFIISFFIAVISAIVTFVVSRKKRKIFLALFIPFLFLYTLYFSSLIGSVIVSETKKVDIGIGDTWHAPVCDSCSIGMIDVPDVGSIRCENGVSIDGVVELQQYSDTLIIGKTTNDFFAFNTDTHHVEYYSSEQELVENKNVGGLNFLKISDFEAEKWREVAGTAMMIVGILSLVISILISYLFSKVFLFLVKRIFKK